MRIPWAHLTTVAGVGWNQADAHKRKLRLQSILEQQRKLGHFEASRECAALVSDADPHASEARMKQRKQDAPRDKGASPVMTSVVTATDSSPP